MVNATEKGKQLFNLTIFHVELFNQKCLLEGPEYTHCVKSVRIRSYSGPYFPALGLNTDRYEVCDDVRIRENTDQNNSEYKHFSRSDNHNVDGHS